MAEMKTKKNDASVDGFLEAFENDQKRKDSLEIASIMKEVTGLVPFMWGDSIVGFGDYHYKYDSGREGDLFLTGFSLRKQNMTIYVMDGFSKYQDLLDRLGKHKTSKACLYFKKMEHLDSTVLKELIQRSVENIRIKHGGNMP